MAYYHLRYNVYPDPGFPVEKEEWIDLPQEQNEAQIKEFLFFKHHTDVSIIRCSLICKQEYELKMLQSAALSNINTQVSANRVKAWLLAEPANMLRKLQEAASLKNLRYRHIPEPAPLL